MSDTLMEEHPLPPDTVEPPQSLVLRCPEVATSTGPPPPTTLPPAAP